MFYRDDLLRAAKGAQRKTDLDIASRAHLSRSTVGRVLDGDPNIGLPTLESVARALGFEDMAALFVRLPKVERAA